MEQLLWQILRLTRILLLCFIRQVLCAGEDDDDENKPADGCDESTKPTMINSIPIMMSYLV
jgi:hypothetical protein